MREERLSLDFSRRPQDTQCHRRFQCRILSLRLIAVHRAVVVAGVAWRVKQASIRELSWGQGKRDACRDCGILSVFLSCLLCDRYSSGEGASGRLGKYVNVDAENILLGDVAGHVVYVHASQLVCMRPFVNVVKDLQDGGALAVIMGNEGRMR